MVINRIVGGVIGLATLVLWARPETIGYAGGGENYANSKHEIRINIKTTMTKTETNP
jgi:hypothetical protein